MSESRSQIPADLKRRVLVEAGHRCAIPTCKYPQVDVHHIVPWAKCLEHRFENLIALCPNCHRMTHRGDIDRKSLLLYKSRLAALFGPDLQSGHEPMGKARVWISSFTDEHKSYVYADSSVEDKYEVQIEYPQFQPDDKHELNKIIRRLIEKESNDIITAARDKDREIEITFGIVGSFNIALHTPLVSSIRFSFTSYTGGAHSNNRTEVINYRTDKLSLFNINDLFAIPDIGIKKLSEHSIEILLNNKKFLHEKDEVERGARPDPRNFGNFNLSTEGVLITFDEYQIGCYAEGRSEILVPYTYLRPNTSDFLENLITEYGGVET